MEVYIPPKKTYHKAGSQGELSPGGRKIKGKQLAVAAAALAVLVALVFIIGSCFGKKTVSYTHLDVYKRQLGYARTYP